MVTTATPAPEAPVPDSSNSFSRIFGVIFSPKATFASIAARPTWIVPLLLLTVISFGMDVLLAKKVDWPGFMRTQLEKSNRLDRIPTDQREQTIQQGALGQKYSFYLRGVIGDTCLALLVAAIYLGIFNAVLGASLKFKTALSVVLYGMVPMGIKELLATAVIALKDYGTVDPINVLASNLGAFLPADSPNWLLVIGILFDVFAFWGMALTIIGFSTADPKKIKTSTAATVVVGLFVFFGGLIVGITALTS
jgi:Yip1 domain